MKRGLKVYSANYKINKIGSGGHLQVTKIELKKVRFFKDYN